MRILKLKSNDENAIFRTHVMLILGLNNHQTGVVWVYVSFQTIKKDPKSGLPNI